MMPPPGMPPPGMPPPNFSVPPPGFPQSSLAPPGTGGEELWVETKTGEGKVHILVYYNVQHYQRTIYDISQIRPL